MGQNGIVERLVELEEEYWKTSDSKFLEELITQSDRVSNEHPNKAESLRMKTRALCHLEQLDNAHLTISQAINLEPQNSNLYLDRANLELRKGDKDKALIDLNMSIKVNPNNHIAYFQKGTVYMLRADFEKALPCFENAVKKDVGNLVYYDVRAVTNYHLGNYYAALRDYRTIYAIDSKFGISSQHLCKLCEIFYFTLVDIKAFEEVSKILINLYPDEAEKEIDFLNINVIEH